MDDSALKGELINGLAEAFNENHSQKPEGSRFNKATGTLMASNTFVNLALSFVDGDGYIKGKVYKCSHVENDHVRIIDTSTAHRTMEGWAYGFPELSKEHREAIAAGNRIAVPGCYATGFISLVYPMVAEGLISADYPVSTFGISGYSGGGRKMIAAYEAEEREDALLAPREYALSQAHKHLKEMKKIPGLKREPLFSPIVADYYSGMVVSVPVYTELMNKGRTPQEVWKYLADFYAGSRFVRVMPFGAEEASANMLAGNAMSGRDSLRIYVTGNEDRVLLSSQFDNLGKGASGAAIQCLNIALGCEESKGLHL